MYQCSYGYAPLVGVLVLLAAGAADGKTLRLGIAGDEYLKPYGIIILFMSQVNSPCGIFYTCWRQLLQDAWPLTHDTESLQHLLPHRCSSVYLIRLLCRLICARR